MPQEGYEQGQSDQKSTKAAEPAPTPAPRSGPALHPPCACARQEQPATVAAAHRPRICCARSHRDHRPRARSIGARLVVRPTSMAGRQLDPSSPRRCGVVRDTHPAVSPGRRPAGARPTRDRAADETSIWIAPLAPARLPPDDQRRDRRSDLTPTARLVFASTRDGSDSSRRDRRGRAGQSAGHAGPATRCARRQPTGRSLAR